MTIILFGYPASPYYQKVILTLNYLNLPYSICPQPNVLPRPDFESLGITYRRIPILSIDGDIYADTSLIIDVLCTKAGKYNDRSTEALGQNIFGPSAMLIPYHLIADEKFLKDRSELTGRPWTQSSIEKNRKSALSQFKSHLSIIEKMVESGFVHGDFGMADIHLLFVVQWVLQGHRGAEPEVSEQSHPGIYAWIKRCHAKLPRNKPGKVTFKDIRDTLLGSTTSGICDEWSGQVAVAPMDTGRNHPQVGTVVLCNSEQIALKTDKGAVIHFPRLGYFVKSTEKL